MFIPFCYDKLSVAEEKVWLITADFNFELLAFRWGSSRDHDHTVKVVSMRQQEDIKHVVGASAAFAHDGMEFAVPLWASGNGYIALYEVTDDENSLLGDRREIRWPEQLSLCFIGSQMAMAFSPSDETLALASSGTVFFINVIDGTFAGWTP